MVPGGPRAIFRLWKNSCCVPTRSRDPKRRGKIGTPPPPRRILRKLAFLANSVTYRRTDGLCLGPGRSALSPLGLRRREDPRFLPAGSPCLPCVKGSNRLADRGSVVRRGRPDGTRKPAGSPPLPAGLTGPTGSIAGLGTMPVFRPGEIVRADRCRRTNSLSRGDAGREHRAAGVPMPRT